MAFRSGLVESKGLGEGLLTTDGKEAVKGCSLRKGRFGVMCEGGNNSV